MALIFLKVHLKDATLKQQLNPNDGAETIANENEYNWHLFHHLHCLARSIYTNAEISPMAYGSLVVMPAEEVENGPAFDLIDLSFAQTLVLRMHDFVLFAVFDDSCATIHGIEDWINAVKAPLNPIQIRELAVRFACCNLQLKNPPTFRTRVINGDPPIVIIEGEHDASPEFETFDKKLFGSMLISVLDKFLPHIQSKEHTNDEMIKMLREGELSFFIDGA